MTVPFTVPNLRRLRCAGCGWESDSFVAGAAGSYVERQWREHVVKVHAPKRELVRVVGEK